jgi:hypothetical protein
MKRQGNFKDFKQFGLVKQKNVVFKSFVCKLGFFAKSGPSHAKKKPNLHTNELNKLLINTSFEKSRHHFLKEKAIN